MMQTTTQNVVVVPGHDVSTYPNYSKKSSLVLGIFHLVLVCVMFIASVVGVAPATNNTVRTFLMIPMIACALVAVILDVFYVIVCIYLAQAVVTIWTSAIGCCVTCCGNNNQTNPSVVMTTRSGAPVVVPMHGQQMQQTSYAPPSYEQQAGGYNPGAGMPPKQ